MNILQQNSTHKAVKKNGKIVIYLKGFTCGDFSCSDEKLYSIPEENSDDLLAIFEELDENNRTNVAEFSAAFQ